MSALGQKQTSRYVRAMSALPPIADINLRGLDGHQVLKADKLPRSPIVPIGDIVHALGRDAFPTLLRA